MDDVDGGGGDGWERIKKKRRALELLLESSDSSESEEELGPRGGKLVRAGGWGRKPRMGDLVSLCLEDRWRWPSWQSNWLNILKNEETYNPKSYWGMNFRGKFRVPRKVFDYLQCSRRLLRPACSPSRRSTVMGREAPQGTPWS